MTSISRAMDKARRNRRAREVAVDGPKVVSLDPDGPLAEPGEDVRKTLREGSFAAAEEHLLTLLSPESIESEHYQTLRFAVERLHRVRNATVIGVSSGSSKDGKTLTTLNLAGSLARDEKSSVLVIDADLRNPCVARFLGMLSSGCGLSSAVQAEHPSLENIARLHPDFKMAVVAQNAPSPAPYEVFKAPEILTIFDQARRLFDFVLVDMPPLFFAETRLVHELLDGLLIVVAAHRTQRTDLARGLDGVDPAKVMGIVFNRDTELRLRMPTYDQHQQD